MKSTKSLMILLAIFAIATLSPNFSGAAINAEGYDFGNVEVGSIQKTLVSITNSYKDKVELTMTFSSTSCSDFSIETSLLGLIAIQPLESINVEIGYSPSVVGECSATLWVFTDGDPWPSNQVTFTGIGVEQEPEQSEPDNISQLLLEKLQKIINYTNESYTYQAFRSYEQDKSPEGRLNAFKTKLMVSYHLIEKGQFEAAHNKLKEIYKKADGKPESNDFVPSEKAAHLALMLQDLIASFDFEDKQAKHSKKAYN